MRALIPNPQSLIPAPRHAARNGVVLLLVLALLTLFAMIGVAFLLVTAQARRSAQSALQTAQVADGRQQPGAAKDLLDQAFMQVARGPTLSPSTGTTASVIGAHSLLEDIYGNGFLTGQVSSSAVLTGFNQVVNLTPASPLSGNGVTYSASADMISAIARHVGCVLTITSVPAGSTAQQLALAGQSTRIVASSTTSPVLQIVSFPDGTLPPANTTFTINGVPFSGTGFGFNPLTGNVDASVISLTFNSGSGTTPFAPGNGITASSSKSGTIATVSDGGATGSMVVLVTTGTFAVGDSITGPGSPGKTASIATVSGPWPAALLPNLSTAAYYSATVNPRSNPPGGANSDYTAADFQHMLLAAQVPVGSPPTSVQTLPSLHRPAVIKYWINNVLGPSGTWPALWSANPDLCRNILLRPNSSDHPNFTGSNPSFNPAWDGITPGGGQWDVDNDGDGVPDSVWVDLGFPVRSSADGHLYKPLFAILCTDLDGRLNLNAHGCLAQIQSSYYGAGTANVTADSRSGAAQVYDFAGATPTPTATLPRGQGYGVAEINLRPLFAAATSPPPLTWYQQLLSGVSASPPGPLDGRYGDLASTPASTPMPSRPNQDWLVWNKLFDYPDSYPSNTNSVFGDYFSSLSPAAPPAAYGSPPDLKGTMAIGLDPRGQPLYQDGTSDPATSGQTLLLADATLSTTPPALPAVDPWVSATNPYSGAAQNTPYAMNLSSSSRGLASPSTAPDNPFSVAELERLLRPYDKDATRLPSRLLTLATPLAPAPTGNNERLNATTDSWDLPCPNVALPQYLAFQARADLGDPTAGPWIRTWLPARNFTDLLTAKYYYQLRNAASPATPAAAMSTISGPPNLVTTNAVNLFSPELLSGLRMNPNWPFANWASTYYQVNGLSGATPTTWSGTLGTDAYGNTLSSIQARQLYARYLYCLALILREPTANAQITTEVLSTALQGGALAPAEELTRRRLAQWAINAACSQTNDSIMVPFEYDIDPFTTGDTTNPTGGWRVDGNITTHETDASGHVISRVVWGAKRPELLLTETLAFHDRRNADTAFDNNTKKKHTDGTSSPADLTLDQPRIPQGSAFFELYCPRNRTNAAAPTDLYTYDSTNNVWRLDLGRLAPADASGLRYPVWRMVISRPANGGSLASPNNDPAARFQAKPDTFVPESQQYVTPPQPAPANPPDPGAADLLPLASPDPLIAIDRIVWFTTQAPTIPNPSSPSSAYHADYDRTYYNRTAAVGLAGDEYCVVGPRAVTYVGAMDPTASSNGLTYGAPSLQKITINPSPVNWTGSTTGNSPVYPSISTQIKPAWGMVVAAGVSPTVASWPTGWSSALPGLPYPWPSNWSLSSPAAPSGFGINISEPMVSGSYYTEPTQTNPATGLVDAYGDLTQTNSSLLFLDLPEDGDGTSNDPKPGKPLNDEGLYTTGTTTGYKTVLLQRLANPQAAYDPLLNPYRTIDWMPIDLTVFSGEQVPPSPASLPSFLNGQWDPADTNWHRTTDPDFGTRERSGTATNYDLWAQTSQRPPDTPPNASATNNGFPYDLVSTLGFIGSATAWLPSTQYVAGAFIKPTPANGHYYSCTVAGVSGTAQPTWPTSGVTVTDGAVTWQDVGTSNWLTAATVPAVPAQYYGDPNQPFPWLTWNNRPFANQWELMLVPATHPGRLLFEYATQFGAPSAAGSAYAYQANPTPPSFAYTPSYSPSTPYTPYPYLLDFFWSQPGTANPPQLHRLMEYIAVPSRFAGTEAQANPANAIGNLGLHPFHPPFNRISAYREPGRINLNTIYSPEVWEGLINYFPDMNATTPSNWQWSAFWQSRQGYSAAGMLTMNSSYPTQFARPFRSFGGAALVPVSGMAPVAETDATLLRSNVLALGAPPVTPLLQYAPATPSAYSDTNRNPFFRYQGLERLGNLVTTRSNVYAVWITVGYFEVTPVQQLTLSTASGFSAGDTVTAPGGKSGTIISVNTGANTIVVMSTGAGFALGDSVTDAGPSGSGTGTVTGIVSPPTNYPDGYTLGAELGSDTGQIIRHRAFYIFDRTLPVGFQRGQDLNVNQAILLKRFIE